MPNVIGFIGLTEERGNVSQLSSLSIYGYTTAAREEVITIRLFNKEKHLTGPVATTGAKTTVPYALPQVYQIYMSKVSLTSLDLI